MSQSPTDIVSPQSSQRYLENWNSLGEMISQGLSFSGRERHRCFLNTRAERFANVSAATGLDLIDDGRGLAVVDWDHDGDLDVWFSSRTGPRVRMMRNDAKTNNHFLAVRLQGKTCNRDAIGARVEVHLNENTPEARTIIKSLRAGEGFLSQSSKWLHFGLGTMSKRAAEIGPPALLPVRSTPTGRSARPTGTFPTAGHPTIDRLVIRWPGSEGAETFTDLTADTRYRIIQGTGHAVIVEKRRDNIRLVANEASGAKSTDVARTLLTRRLPVKNLKYEDFGGRTRDLIPSNASPRLINVWASWCQPCIAELQELAQHAGELQQHGLSVVALCTDRVPASGGGFAPSDLSAAKKVLEATRFPFEAGVASDQLLEELTSLDHRVFYHQLALPIPCSFLLDSRQKLAAIYKGPIDVQQVMNDLKLLTASQTETELAAFPFSGRRVIKDYDPSPLGLAAAYLEAGYLEDARTQVLQHLKTVASVQDFDQLTTTLLETLRPGVVHERPATASAIPSTSSHESPRDALDDTAVEAQIRRGLQTQQVKALARGHRMLARIEYQRKAFDDQINALQHLVELLPNDVTARADLAVALWRQKRQQDADVVLNEALQENEVDARALVIIGQAKMKLGHAESAVELFRRATKLTPHSVEARLNLAMAGQLQGDSDLAIEQYRLILDKHPESLEALNNLAWMYATAVDPGRRNASESVSLARRLCQASEYEVPAYLDTLATALAATGEFGEAIDITQSAIKLARGRAEPDLANKLTQRLGLYRSAEDNVSSVKDVGKQEE